MAVRIRESPFDPSSTLTDTPDPLPVGNVLTYRMDVGNAGPASATNVEVRLSFSFAVTLSSAPGDCSGLIGTHIDCDFGTIASGGSRSVAILIVPVLTGTLSASATVSADQPDPNGSNNSASTTTGVTLLQRASTTGNVTLRSSFIATSAEALRSTGVVRLGSRLVEQPEGSELTLSYPNDGDTWIEVHTPPGTPEGTWRFEALSDERRARFEVEAGQALAMDAAAIVFRIAGETRIRFRIVR